MIIVKNLTKKYNTKVKDEEVIALNKINLALPDKGFVAVYGASGCGKSTLLNVLGGLDQADFGEMIVNGRTTKGFTAADWNSYRNQEVGFVFQNYYLLPHLTVFDNIAITLQMAKQTENLQEKIHDALNQVDLAKYAKRYPRQLSGGQQQRVAIARALIANPSIILADEPTGALDEKSSKLVMKTLQDVAKEHLVVMVTHNERMAKQYAERLIEISYGSIIYDSNPLELNDDLSLESKPLPPVHLPAKTSMKWSAKNVIKKKSRSIPIAIASGIGLAAAGVVLSMSQGVNKYVRLAQANAIQDYPVYVTCHSKNSSQFNELNLEEFPDSTDIIIEKSDYKAQEHYVTMQDKFIEYMDKGLVAGEDYDHLCTNKMVKFNLFAKPTSDSYVKVDTATYTTCIAPNELTYKFLMENQYDYVYGETLPRNKNELTLVVDTFNRVDLYALQKMGFDTSGDTIKASDIVTTDKDATIKKEYKVVNNDKFYYPEDKEVETENGKITRQVYKTYGTSHYEELFNDPDNLTLKIVSIIRPKRNTTSSIYNTVLLCHPELLENYLLDPETGINAQSEVVKAQKSHPDWDAEEGYDYVPTFRSGYELTVNYQYENSLVNLGGKDRVTSYFYYTTTPEQRIKIIEYAQNYEKVEKAERPKDDTTESDLVIKTKDYLESVTASFTSLVRTFSVVLLAFSFVSILVAGILTAILTYVSVVERKREIGLLRSLGARQRDVSMMFIAEAMIIGVVAGVLGIGLCYAFSPLVATVVVNLIDIANYKFISPKVADLAFVQPWIIPTLFAAAIVVGVISSLVPAIIAGHKKPADALKE